MGNNKRALYLNGIIVICALSMAACGPGFESEKAGSAALSSDNGNGTLNTDSNGDPIVDPPKVASVSFAQASMAMTDSNLGVEHQIKTTLSGKDGFSGMISFSVNRAELDIIDKENDIEIGVDPASASLAAGGSVEVTLTVNVKTSSHSFASSSFSLVATESGGLSTQVEVPLKVNPVYQVKLMGGNSPEVWDSPTTPINIRKHAGGTTVLFMNFDMGDTHVVHGAGAVVHGPTDSPMAASTVQGQVGGTYQVVIADDRGPVLGGYYCHNHESNGLRRNINFNFDDVVVAAIAAVAAPAPAEEPGHNCHGE